MKNQLSFLRVILLTLLFSFNYANGQVKYFNLTTTISNIGSNIKHNGYVGIGTNITTPLNNLHVDGAIRITGQPYQFAGPTLIFGRNTTINPDYGQYCIEYYPNQGLNFSIPRPNPGAGNFDLFLSHTNKVGMGTNNFSCSDCNEYRLFVKNGIRTEKIKVDVASNNGWADYVFNDSYKLTSLTELEKFIKTNRHLPEVPSESEAIDNGIELKEMNILLLKKIEELTLHIIELDKRISEMEEIKK